jgi:hypothetical protein
MRKISSNGDNYIFGIQDLRSLGRKLGQGGYGGQEETETHV